MRCFSSIWIIGIFIEREKEREGEGEGGRGDEDIMIRNDKALTLIYPWID